MFAAAWLSYFVIFNRHISLGLHVGLGLGLLYFVRLYRQQKISWAVFFPFLPLLAIAISATAGMIQGEGSGDFRYVWMGLSMAITGMAVGSAFPRKSWIPIILLPLAVSSITLYYFILGEISGLNSRISIPICGTFNLGLLSGFSTLIYIGNLRDMTRGFKIALFLPAFLIPLIILSLTGTRSLFAAFAVSIACYVLFFADHRRIIIPLCLVAILTAGFFFSKSEVRMHRLETDIISHALLIRMNIWDITFQGFLEKPIIGHQKSNFRGYYLKSIKENTKKRLQEKAWLKKIKPFLNISYRTPHNIYIGILFCWGIIGFISFSISSGFIIFAALREKYVFPVLATIFIALAGLFDFFIYTKSGLFIIFIVAGLAAGRHWGKPHMQHT